MKTIPSQLQDHYNTDRTTVCALAKVECAGQYAGIVYGFTSLNRDVTYNDGTGSLLYRSDNGFTPSRNVHTSAAKVDDAELEGIISAEITEQKVRAGLFKSARVTVYRVNYQDLTTGRHEIIDYGKAGQTEFSELGWKTEFRSLSQWLMQIITEVYSTTCRATFGDSKCKKALVWVNSTITSVGAEPDRVFVDTAAIGAGLDFYRYGVIEVLGGNNQYAQMEIDTFNNATGQFTLALPFDYPLLATTAYRRRQDCSKTFEYCKTVHNNWLEFRGERFIPLDGSAMVPGAEIERA